MAKPRRRDDAKRRRGQGSVREGLSARQEAFVAEYLKDLNASQAATRAGYAEKSASVTGARLLANAKVAAAIAAAKAEREKRTEVTIDRVVEELAYIAFFDPADIAREKITDPAAIADLPEGVRRAIAGWRFDRDGNLILNTGGKAEAAALLLRHLGGLNDRLHITGGLGEAIEEARARARQGGDG